MNKNDYFWGVPSFRNTPELHRTMLADKARTKTFRDFIFQNRHLFKDKSEQNMLKWIWDIRCNVAVVKSSGESIEQKEAMYICIIYIPNLGLEIAVSVREKEQGYFRRSR